MTQHGANATAATTVGEPVASPRPPIAYLVLRFPKISETFVAREIAALRDMGWDVRIYPLWRDDPPVVHEVVKPLLSVVRWAHPVSPGVVAANLRALVRTPKRYLSTLAFVASDVIRSPKRALKSIALYPLMVWLAGDMHRQGIAHVHAHFASYPALAALVAHRLAGISYSFTAHAYDIYVRPLRLPEKIEHARFVITISEYNRQLLSDIARGDTPIHVIHCGVDVPESLPPADPETGHIVSVARLEPKKGLAYLIDACAELQRRGVEHTCAIIGGGPEEATLRARIERLGLTDTVRLLGPQPFERVQAELRRACVFALPSVVTPDGNADGIPVALMEAMAAGVPVVSTRVTGIPELIEDGISGLLVAPRDVPALADALQRLLADPGLRDSYRQAGYERVAKEYRLKSCVLDVARAIDEAVSS